MVVKVASIQLYHNDEDTKQKRIEHAENLIRKAGDADLILLPEIWNIGWWSFDKYQQESETLNRSETISRMASIAKEVDAYIVAGSIVERVKNSLYNTSVLIDNSGRIAATYRKMHIPRWIGREAELISPGDAIATLETDLGVFGFSICYDIRFPELYRKMAINHGVNILIHVTAWPIVRQDNLRELWHVRANENLCFLVSCSSSGFNYGNQFFGHSAIVDPMGISIASGGFEECIVRGEIDTEEIVKARERIKVFQDRVLSI